LKLFIAKVDAKLLKAVELKNLETIDIQNPNAREGLFWHIFSPVLDVFVDSVDDPLEQSFIESF